MVGYRAGHDFVVTAIGGPGALARSSAGGFEPDTRHNQRIVNRHFEVTSGLASYLGEWHTHPRGPLRPSQLDLETMRSIRLRPGVTSTPIVVIARRRLRLSTRSYAVRASSLVSLGALVVVDPETLPQTVQRSVRLV